MPAGGLRMSREAVAVTLSTTSASLTPAASTDLVAGLFQDPLGANSSLADVPGTVTLTGLRAALDSGVLTVESTSFGPGQVTISSSPLDGANAGLLDANSADPLSNAYLTAGTTGSLTLDYLDLQGIARTVTLTQDGGSPGGLTFRNTAGGPEAGPPYTAYDVGAFSVTLRDTTDGSIGALLSVSDATAYTATRDSSTFIHTGALSDQRVEIDIPDVRANALGFSAGLAGSGFATLQAITTVGAITQSRTAEALTVIDAAINEVTATRGRLGAIQANGVEAALNNLQATTENLTASESRLRDADFALESATFTKQQILHQAANAMLAQANQIPQTVVDLLNIR
jgi:flagellin